MQTLDQRIAARVAARKAAREALTKPSSILTSGFGISPTSISGGDDWSPDPAAIIQASRGDTLPPVEIRASAPFRSKLEALAPVAAAAGNPLMSGAPQIFSATRKLAGFANDLFGRPLKKAVSPLIGSEPTVPTGGIDPGDPQINADPVTRETGGVTPEEKLSGIAATAVNVAWPGAQRALTRLAVSELGAGLGARVVGSGATGAGLMGAHGAAEGAIAPAGNVRERIENALEGGFTGMQHGVIAGAALHFAAEGLPAAARLAVRAADKTTTTAAALRDFSLASRRRATGPKEPGPPTGVESTPAATPAPVEAPRPVTPIRNISEEEIFTPANIQRFEELRAQPAPEPNLELRERIRRGEDLSDAEVHLAEPGHQTIYDTLDMPHPTKPGTTIGAEEKRLRIRRPGLRPVEVDEAGLPRDFGEELEPTEVITNLRRTLDSPGGKEYGDFAGMIEGIERDMAEGRPLTRGRLRAHVLKSITDHGKADAIAAGAELKNDGIIVFLAGPPGSGKSTVANAIGNKIGAYQIDADFAKVRLPEYADLGAAGTHEESSYLADKAIRNAVRKGENIIIPTIGRNEAAMRASIEALTKAGRTVYYVLGDLSPEASSVRAFNRRLHTGRDVALEYVLNTVGRAPAEVFERLRTMPELAAKTLRLDQRHPPTTPLHERVIEHGEGFDPALIGGASRRQPSGVPGGGPELRPAASAVPAETGGEPGRLPGPGAPAGAEVRAPAASADVDLFGEPVAPAAGPPQPTPWEVQQVPVWDLHVDPKRFQYKQDVDAATGEGTHLKSAKKFDKRFGGVIDVWRDPESGLDYVVNGHHRFALAKRSGEETVAVRWIDPEKYPTWKDARAFGALKNIAGGKGTALDVAKFMADTGLGVDDLVAENIAVRAGVARDGAALASLPKDLLTRVYQDPGLMRKAVIVGENLTAPEQARAAFGAMEKLTERQTEELTKVIRAAGSESVEQESLFGADSMAQSLFVEKAKVAAAIRERLSKDKRLFGFVSDAGRAAELERGGNKISVEKSKAIAQESAQLEELFDRLYSSGGRLGGVMDLAARRVSRGEKPGAVASEVYQDILDAIKSEAPVPLKRAGRAGSTNEAAGLELGGMAGSGLGAGTGGIVGGQIGDSPEERRRNAAAGFAIGAGLGGAAGAVAGRAAFRGATAALSRPADAAGLQAAKVFNLRATRERVSVRIQGRPSVEQLSDIITAMRKNPGAGFRYVLRDMEGRQVSAGNKIWDLWSDVPYGAKAGPLEGPRIGAVGDQADIFGAVEKPQASLFSEEAGRTQRPAPSSFSAKQKEAAQNVEFLRKQLPRVRDPKQRQGLAKMIADLERVANFDAKVTAPELATRAAAGERTGAVGNQPARGAYMGETDLLNVSKIVEDQTAAERLAAAAEKYRGTKEANRQTWAEADVVRANIVKELTGRDPKAAKPHIARKLTGVQLLARRDVVRQNDALIETLSKQIESKSLPFAEHQKAVELLDRAIQHNDALLSDIIIGASQKGRDLNLLKRMANKSLDHDVWQLQAKRMLGPERPLTDEMAAQIRKLVNEARAACG